MTHFLYSKFEVSWCTVALGFVAGFSVNTMSPNWQNHGIYLLPNTFSACGRVAIVYKTVVLSNGQEAMLDWLKKEDIPEVVEVLNDVIKEGRYLFMNDPIADMKKELEWYERATRDGMLYLTAKVDGKFVGGASIHPQTDKHLHVASYGIFVGKNHRNLGLGTLLTKEFIEIAKKQELEILQLTVYANNERAFHVYKKCGFRRAGRLTKGIKFLDGTYTDEILMELLLK